MKFKSIRMRITVTMLIMVMIPLLVLAVYCSVASYRSSISLMESNIEVMSKLAAERVNWELNTYVGYAQVAGSNRELSSPLVSDARKKTVLEELSQRYGMKRGSLIDANGIELTDGKDFSDRRYYQEAMAGRTCIFEPTVSKLTGETIIVIASPLWASGVVNSTSVGCAYLIAPDDFLNDIMRGIDISENCYAYMMDHQGGIVAHVESGMILNEEGHSTGRELAAVQAKMIAGESGSAICTENGQNLLVGYAPIAGTNGWSLAVCAPANDFMNGTKMIIMFDILLVILAVLISVINARRFGYKIGEPLRQCANRLRLLSQGDLKSPVPEVKTGDETKVLADATGDAVRKINIMISDLVHNLTEMSQGNFNVHSACGDAGYPGDFKPLRKACQDINMQLSDTLSKINAASDQVFLSSDQVSNSAQALSQSTTQQAASVEELAASIRTISDRVSSTTANCENGNMLVQEMADYIDRTTEEMGKLTAAMVQIGDTSNEISAIIKTIEDIAFQTNILALNAAVEAARAGAAGKGFAVVADEVRSLASKSAEAAQNTTTLIEHATKAVENGTLITGETAAAVASVEERSGEVRKIVAQIAEDSVSQTEMIKQVTVGIEQISGVVQTNSASSQESAAAAGDLSSQASTLKKLVGKFKLRG